MCEKCVKSHSDGTRTALQKISKSDFHVRNEIRRTFAIFKADRYENLAAQLSDLLIRNWDAEKRAAITEVIRTIKGSSPFTDSDLQKALEILRAKLGDAFTGDVAQAVLEVNFESYKLGATGTASLVPSFRVANPAALAWLETHQIYWVKTYFDRQLAGKVSEAAAQVITDGMDRDKAAKFFQQLFKDKFDVASYAYWDGFANHVTTRAREFGHVEKYVKAGVKFLRVVAQLDYRTSSICRYMNNRIIPIADAVELRDKMMKAQNPEDVKAIAPFLKEADVKGVKTTELKAKSSGYALPPYHFDCRSRTVLYEEPKIKIKSKGEPKKKPGSDAELFIEGYTDEELSLWFSEIKSFGGSAQYNPTDLKQDLKKHSKEFEGIQTAEDYVKKAKKTIKTASKITVGAYKDQLMFTLYGKDAMVVLDADLSIRGLYGHRDVDKAFTSKGKNESFWYVLE